MAKIPEEPVAGWGQVLEQSNNGCGPEDLKDVSYLCLEALRVSFGETESSQLCGRLQLRAREAWRETRANP